MTVRNNKISTGGNAVYLEQVRNVNVIENEMTCSKSKFATKTCNPLTTLNCAVASVSGNIVKSSSEQGFEIAISTVKSITGNHIANVKIDGILLEAESRVTEKISGNIITKAARYGLNLRPKCGGGTVSGNIIYDSIPSRRRSARARPSRSAPPMNRQTRSPICSGRAPTRRWRTSAPRV